MYELKCRDVGFDCAGVVRGATIEEVLKQAAAHASDAHRTQITPELAEKVKALIRDEGSPGGGKDSG
jgi:predicted small metal-binding protein